MISAPIGALIEEALVSLTEDMAAVVPTIGDLDVGDLPGLPPGFVLQFQGVTVGLQDNYLTLSGDIR